MEFLKKHYEKIVLSVVLLGLAAAAAALPLMVSQAQQQIEDMDRGVKRSKPKPWTLLDLSTNQAAIRRVESPGKVNLAGEHNVFNPVKWVRRGDGTVRKIVTGNEIGAGALRITRIEPLDLEVTFDGVRTNANKVQYLLTITEERTSNARSNQRSAPLGVKGQFFTVERVVGDPADPQAVIVRLKDDTDTITITKDQPYKRIMSYMADLTYPLGNEEFKKKRAGDRIVLKGEGFETNKIVAINQNEVVLSTEPTGKRTTIKFNSSP
jgi:hypothetical protein